MPENYDREIVVFGSEELVVEKVIDHGNLRYPPQSYPPQEIGP